VGLRAGLEAVEKRDIAASAGRKACSLVTILTELSGFLQTGVIGLNEIHTLCNVPIYAR